MVLSLRIRMMLSIRALLVAEHIVDIHLTSEFATAGLGRLPVIQDCEANFGSFKLEAACTLTKSAPI